MANVDPKQEYVLFRATYEEQQCAGRRLPIDSEHAKQHGMRCEKKLEKFFSKLDRSERSALGVWLLDGDTFDRYVLSEAKRLFLV